jgi:hypothetical protein
LFELFPKVGWGSRLFRYAVTWAIILSFVSLILASTVPWAGVSSASADTCPTTAVVSSDDDPDDSSIPSSPYTEYLKSVTPLIFSESIFLAYPTTIFSFQGAPKTSSALTFLGCRLF